jgi:Protein of unknown function (DUF2934)
MTTNQNTKAAAGSTSKAKTICGTDTTQLGAEMVEESELLWQSTREQEIRNRAYEIYLQRGTEPGDEAQDGFGRNESSLNNRPITHNKEYR